MRRVVTLTLVGVALSVALISEALAAPKASVTDRIAAGELITIEASDCFHGDDYTAYIDVTVTRDDGQVVHESSAPSQNTDPDVSQLRMDDPGSYKVKVRCRHQFDGTRSGTWYEETEDLVVTGLTSDEKKRCKKKSTAKARRRCLRRERAD